MRSSRSKTFSEASGKSVRQGTVGLRGRVAKKSSACCDRMKASSSSGRVPSTSICILSVSIKSAPAKMGERPSSSARMQPTLHMSMAGVYWPSADSISSGARYHRVTTCSVMVVGLGASPMCMSEPPAAPGGIMRARPKSLMHRSQFLVTSCGACGRGGGGRGG